MGPGMACMWWWLAQVRPLLLSPPQLLLSWNAEEILGSCMSCAMIGCCAARSRVCEGYTHAACTDQLQHTMQQAMAAPWRAFSPTTLPPDTSSCHTAVYPT